MMSVSKDKFTLQNKAVKQVLHTLSIYAVYEQRF